MIFFRVTLKSFSQKNFLRRERISEREAAKEEASGDAGIETFGILWRLAAALESTESCLVGSVGTFCDKCKFIKFGILWSSPFKT